MIPPAIRTVALHKRPNPSCLIRQYGRLHYTSIAPRTILLSHDLRHPKRIINRQSFRMASNTANASFTRDNLFNMKGRVALITGAGSGIGLMATQALVANGAKVYIAGRTTEKLERVVEKYSQGKDSIVALQCDVRDKAQIANLVKEISSREKCLCILINNAGIAGKTFPTESKSADEMKSQLFDTEEATHEDWTSVYETNVASVFFTTTAFLPLLQKSTELHEGWSGTVINISSISGMVKSAQHHFAYNASKAAAVHLTRMLAAEIAENGIKVRVNSIAPGVFPSEMAAEDGSDENQKSHIPREKYADKVAAGRPGKDEDMAQTVLFFAANQYLNGQTLAVDGGYTLAAGL